MHYTRMSINSRYHHYMDENDDNGGGGRHPAYFPGSLPETDSGHSIATSIMGTHDLLPYQTTPTSLVPDPPYSTATPSLTNDSVTSSSQQYRQQQQQLISSPAASASRNNYIRTHDVISRIEGHFGMLSAAFIQQQQDHTYMTPAFDDRGAGLIYPRQQQQNDGWVYGTRVDTSPSSASAALPWAVGTNIIQPLLMIHTALQQQQLPFHQAPLFQHHPHHSPSTVANSKAINAENSEYLPSPSSASGEDAIAASVAGLHTYHHHNNGHPESNNTTTSNFFPPLENHHRHQKAGPSVIHRETEDKDEEKYDEQQQPQQHSSEHTHHSAGTPRYHMCIECTASFGRRQDLKRHASTVHKRVLPFECQSCHRHFSRKDSMLRHERNSCHHRRKGGVGMDEDEDEDEDDRMASVAVAAKQRSRRSNMCVDYQQQQQQQQQKKIALPPVLSPSSNIATGYSSARAGCNAMY